MNRLGIGALASTAWLLLAAPSQAESLRCNGALASEGDSRLSVQYKCGAPLLKDTFCAPVYVPNALQPVPELAPIMR